MASHDRRWSWFFVMLLVLTSTVPGWADALATQPVATATVRDEAMALLEDLERTRMLLGAAMWRVHDLRNFALSGAGDVAGLQALDRRHLELYETIKPIDY